jgi:arylformamidase
MRIIDLSYDLSENTMVYPGLFKPLVEEEKTIVRDGINIKRITLITHTGTHIDAPRHCFDDGATVDKMQLYRVVGEAAAVNLERGKKGRLIGPDELIQFEQIIRKGDILVLNTGIYKSYGTQEFNYSYPAISKEAAQWIVSRGITALAIDATSVDPYGDDKADAHRTLLGAGIPIVENLANLGRIKQDRFLFIALPLKIKDGDGAPCRAIAIEGMI